MPNLSQQRDLCESRHRYFTDHPMKFFNKLLFLLSIGRAASFDKANLCKMFNMSFQYLSSLLKLRSEGNGQYIGP
jgi:hypothetical protein